MAARAVRQRAGDHSRWRAGITFNGRDFWPAIAPNGPFGGGHERFKSCAMLQ
jgi:hypothetical protein